MERISIVGGHPLSGDVSVSGAKNAVVAVIPAALLCDGVCVIENLPDIEDVSSLVDAINTIGVKTKRINANTLEIDSSGISTISAKTDSVKKMRASYYLMGALLGRFKKAEVALPGGCDFGTRPIDLHIKAFEQLGAKTRTEHGVVTLEAAKLVGTNIYFDRVSVGATINTMLAAVFAEGVTVIENSAKEPHVVDTANFLNSMGANVKGAGTDVIRIIGVEKLSGSQYMIIPDQIQAGTFMIASAITAGDVVVGGVIPKHMEALTSKLSEMGAQVSCYDEAIRVRAKYPLTSVNLQTMPYPGFPTDLQPQMAALLSISSGRSIITENIFDNRFQYVSQLKRLGANIMVEGRVAIIEGSSNLTGSEVYATDLRAGAALVMGGLVAKGETLIGNIKYIDRGYDNIVKKLSGLGAEIARVEK